MQSTYKKTFRRSIYLQMLLLGIVVTLLYYQIYNFAFFILAVLMVYFDRSRRHYRDYQLYTESMEWQKVEGKIIKATIRQERYSWRGDKHYTPYILYEYTIDNERYVSKVVSQFEEAVMRKDELEAKDISRSLGHLRDIDVYVNPQEYNQSYLTNVYDRAYLEQKHKEVDKDYAYLLLISLYLLELFKDFPNG